jgi:hypothetical protein
MEEIILQSIASMPIGLEGTLTLEEEPKGLLGAEEHFARFACRGDGPMMERTIASVTGRQWMVIGTG